MAQRRVVVVGAGMAGLTVARALAADHDVLVVDKGRGVGGRMATRRIDGTPVDHGAQFLTAHSEAFRDAVADWQDAGVVAPWFQGEAGPGGPPGVGHVRFRGVPSMTAIARHLAEGLRVRTGTAVVAVEPAGRRWNVRLDDGSSIAADAVVLTAPVPQGLAICRAGGVVLPADASAALEDVAYEPCLAVMAVLDGPSGLPAPGAIAPADGPLAWVADAGLKGTADEPAVVLHARPEVSRERWDDERSTVAADLIAAAGLASPVTPGTVQVHGWRYARPVGSRSDPCVVVDGAAPLVWAGDAFGGPSVEGAHRSGTAAAAAVGTPGSTGQSHDGGRGDQAVLRVR